MAQVPFTGNVSWIPDTAVARSDALLQISPVNIFNSVSLNNLIFGVQIQSGTRTVTYSFGFYSLTAGTLSLENSCSITISASASFEQYRSITSFSKTQNITPGTWYLGVLYRSNSNNNALLLGHGHNWGSTNAPANAFPYGFFGGMVTNTTSALPVSVATSDLSTVASASGSPLGQVGIIISA